MDNKQAVTEITKHAQSYKNNLLDKNLLFVFQNGKSIEFIETEFTDRRYLHLTGVEITKNVGGASMFFQMAENGTLNETLIKINAPKIIDKKMSALDQTMSIQTTAREVGDFQNNGGNLYTEKLSGSAKACLGFILDDKKYIPNTNLQGDVRLFSKNPTFPIILTMRKEIEDEKYSEITFKSPNFSFSDGKYPQEMLDLMTVKAKNQLQIPFPDIKTLENFNVKRVMDEDPIDEEKHYYAVLEHEGEHKRYEILNGIENASITALCEDFAISVKLAREILDKAEEQEPDHSKSEKKQPDEPPKKQIDEPNKDPPDNDFEPEIE